MSWYHCVSDRCLRYHKEVQWQGSLGRCKECKRPLRYIRPSKTRREIINGAKK